MVEEKESFAHVHIEAHKETGSHDPDDDGVLLENDKRASAERRLVKKLDHRLLPTIVVILHHELRRCASITLDSIACAHKF